MNEVQIPIFEDLSTILQGEIKSVHDVERLDELLFKRNILNRIMKQIKKG